MSGRYLEDALRTLKYYADRAGHDGNWNLALAAEQDVEERIASARAEGYAKAREQAAALADDERGHGCDPYMPCTCDWEGRLDGLPESIRAMQDERARETRCDRADCCRSDGCPCARLEVCK